MYCISNLLSIPHNFEILSIIIIGVIYSAFDSSLFDLKANLTKVWHMSLNQRLFPLVTQVKLKYIMTAVIFIRTFTLHVLVALYIVMLWPAIFENKRCLLLPWLLVASVRFIGASLISLSAGLFILHTQYQRFTLLALDFTLSQIIDHGPGIYAWFSVYKYYFDLKLISAERRQRRLEEKYFQMVRRRRAKGISLCNNNMDDEDRNLISETIIINLFNILNKSASLKPSRSLDSLLVLKAVEDEEIEILSTTDSAFVDEEDENDSTCFERAMHLLNIVYDDIVKAKKEKSERALRILSDITLDALTFIGKNRPLKSVSSARFCIKNGRNCRLNMEGILPKRLLHGSFLESQVIKEEDFEEVREEKVLEKTSVASLSDYETEMELVNMFFEANFFQTLSSNQLFEGTKERELKKRKKKKVKPFSCQVEIIK